MPLYKGPSEITDIYKGDTHIVQVYKGDTLVWDNSGLKVWKFIQDANGVDVPTLLIGNYDTNDLVAVGSAIGTLLIAGYATPIYGITGTLGTSESTITLNEGGSPVYTYVRTLTIQGKTVYEYYYLSGGYFALYYAVFVIEGSTVGSDALVGSVESIYIDIQELTSTNISVQLQRRSYGGITWNASSYTAEKDPTYFARWTKKGLIEH